MQKGERRMRMERYYFVLVLVSYFGKFGGCISHPLVSYLY